MTTRHTPPLTYDEARTIARDPAAWPDDVVAEAYEVLTDAVRRMPERQVYRDYMSEPNLWTPINERQMHDDEEGDGSAWGLVFLLSAAFWLVLGVALFLGGLW